MYYYMKNVPLEHIGNKWENNRTYLDEICIEEALILLPINRDNLKIPFKYTFVIIEMTSSF